MGVGNLGEGGKPSGAGEGRSSFLEHARERRRDERKARERGTEVVVEKATAFAPEPGP